MHHHRRHLFERERPSHGASVGIGLVAAAAIAAGVYFLYGTDEGAKRRKKIARMAKRFKDEASDTVADVKEKGKEAYEAIGAVFKDRYEDLKDASKEDIEEIKELIKEKQEELMDEINEAIERIKGE